MRTIWFTKFAQRQLPLVAKLTAEITGDVEIRRAFESSTAPCDQTDGRWSLGEIFVVTAHPPGSADVAAWASHLALSFLSLEGVNRPSAFAFDEEWRDVGEACYAALVQEFNLVNRHTCLLISWPRSPFQKIADEPGVVGACPGHFDVVLARQALSKALQPRKKLVFLDDELPPLDAWADAFHGDPLLGGKDIADYMYCSCWVPEWAAAESAAAVGAVLSPDDLVVVDGKLGTDPHHALRSAACCEVAALVVRGGTGVVLPTSSVSTSPAWTASAPDEVLPRSLWVLKPKNLAACRAELPLILQRLAAASAERARIATQQAANAGIAGVAATAATAAAGAAAAGAGQAVAHGFQQAVAQAQVAGIADPSRVERWTATWPPARKPAANAFVAALRGGPASGAAVATAFLMPGLPLWGDAVPPQDAIHGLARLCTPAEWADGPPLLARRELLERWWAIAADTRCAWAAFLPSFQVADSPLQTLYGASTTTGDTRLEAMLAVLSTANGAQAFVGRVRFNTNASAFARTQAAARFARGLGLPQSEAVVVAFVLMDLGRIAGHHRKDYYPDPASAPGHRNGRSAHTKCWEAAYRGASVAPPFSDVIAFLAGQPWPHACPTPLDILRGWILCHLFA